MPILALLGILLVIAIPIGAIMGMMALSRSRDLARRLERLEQALRQLQRRADPPPASDPLPAPPAPVCVAPAPAAPAVQPEPPGPEARGAGLSGIAAALAAAQPAGDPPRPPSADLPPAPAGGDLESEVGKRWLTWAGVAVLFLAAVFFLKYAYDQGWIGRLLGPRVRIALIAAASLTAVASGLLQIRRGFTALGQGLAGGGIALGYLAVYGAFSTSLGIVPEQLLPPGVAFALMAVVSAAGMACAVRFDAVAMAVVATLGGLATPLLVATGHDDRDLLAGYLLLLDLAVLGACTWRAWRGLDLLAFIGTALLLLLAGGTAAHPHPDLALLGWLAAFHPVFLAMAFALPWRTRAAVPPERYALALANLAFGLGWTAWELAGSHDLVLALLCFALAGAYHLIGELTRRRIPGDPAARDGFRLLSAVLILLGLFYLLPVDGIATAWAVEAAALAWLGHRNARPALRWSALAVLGLVIGRCLLHIGSSDHAAPLVANAWFLSLLAAPGGCLALAWVHRRWGASGGEATLARWLGVAAMLLLMFIGAAELDRHADGHRVAWSGIPLASVIALLWTLGAGGLLAWWRHRQGQEAAAGGLVILASAAVAVTIPFGCSEAIGSWPFLDLRSLAALLVIVISAWAARIHQSLGWAAFAGVVLLLSVEPSQWCWQSIGDPRLAAVAAHLSVTVAWTLCAAGLLAWGFLRRQRACRYAALALFALTAGKLLLVDMADARQLTRIIAFLIVGLVLIAASYAYHRLERRLDG